MSRQPWFLVTAAMRARAWLVGLVLLAAVLIVSGCGGGKSAAGTTTAPKQNPPPASSPPPPVPPPTPQPPPPPPPTPPPPPVPPEPSTPRIIPGHCQQVYDQTNTLIEASDEPEPELHAYRAMAGLCLGRDATDDLAVARSNLDELKPETREVLQAVIDAGLPRGAELRTVIRENTQ
jgi:type IV secretory pathway VirB10-like protein